MSITSWDHVRRLFVEHTPEILERLTPNQRLYTALKQKSIINAAVEQELKVPIKTDDERVVIILKSVQDKGVSAFLDFCLLLAEERFGMEGIVIEVLGLNLDDIKKQKDGLAVDSASPQVSTSGAHAAAPPSVLPATQSAPPQLVPAPQASTTGEENQFILGGVKPVTVEEAIRKLADPSVYPMKSKPHGKAIIINIEKYDKAKKNRDGSNTDLVNLTLLLTNLGFKVDTWSNYDSRKIRDSIKQECQSPDHTHSDAFVMCVLSHGRKGQMEATDGKYLKIQEDLVNPFNGVNTPGLVNKPKMFFIQACQGNDKTNGVGADGDEDDLEALPSGGSSQQPERMSHEMADILVVNSTVEGYSSFRDPTMGSFFMRDLVNVFTEKSHTDHVEDMITEVTRRLNDRKIGSKGRKQICEKSKCALTRKVYFLPGYYADS